MEFRLQCLFTHWSNSRRCLSESPGSASFCHGHLNHVVCDGSTAYLGLLIVSRPCQGPFPSIVSTSWSYCSSCCVHDHWGYRCCRRRRRSTIPRGINGSIWCQSTFSTDAEPFGCILGHWGVLYRIARNYAAVDHTRANWILDRCVLWQCRDARSYLTGSSNENRVVRALYVGGVMGVPHNSIRSVMSARREEIMANRR